MLHPSDLLLLRYVLRIVVIIIGTDAILLGAETLRGLYPVEAITTVGKICAEVRMLLALVDPKRLSHDIKLDARAFTTKISNKHRRFVPG
jgi:pyruvate kinase